MALKTSFGMYVPCEYELYMKLKKIKAAINLSRIQRRRFEKWFRKAPHNRIKPEPFAPCSVFWEKTTKQIKRFVCYKKTTGKTEIVKVDIDYYAETDVSHQKFYDAWKVAATPKENPEDVQTPELDWMIVDGVYNECFEWFQGFKQNRNKLPIEQI